ncbi:MAG TPA: amino acid adenylation domain-containing protein [Dyella sp.]|uniref:hybrid non-ribosomal peptide synthetase/type I polyketide synthase n=1 Tax=Dyella sp. TaxID=1869338 RepID=UPI002F940335
MNACTDTRMEEACADLRLFDALPAQVVDSDAWGTCQFALDTATGTATVERLCAALALTEALFTGADAVLATYRDATQLRQAVLEVPADDMRDAWLQNTYRQLAGAPEATRVAAWYVDVHGETDAAAQVYSRWSLGTDGRLTVAFRAPFNEASIALFAGTAVRTLAELGSSTDVRLDSLDLLSPVERRQLMHDWNNTAVVRRAEDTVHGLFAECARCHPERVAIAAGDSELSYGELDARANHVAAGLIAAGVEPGQPIALLLERSVDAVVALLGVLKAGAAYLPLDPTYPAERLAFVIGDARAALIVAEPGTIAPAGIDLPVTSLDRLEREENCMLPALGGDALAYVMYTSGSTGTPKGAEILHRAIIRLVRDGGYVDLGNQPRLLHAAPLGFDASTLEIWGALLNGGTCVVHAERIPTGDGLARTIAQHRPRIAWLTAALFNAIVDDEASKLQGLEQLLIGGEALSPAHVRKAYAALPDIAIFNGYGPTECTTFATTYPIPRELSADARSIPIGRPIADTTLYILNARRQAVPVGAIGELYIGGAGLARGYLARPELTAERFVTHPFAQSERLYRTGDLVRWLPDGTIEFIGRADGQVKIRGYRIEIGEIEAALQSIEGVRACAVLVREDRPGQKRLVAYYVLDDTSLDARELRERLSRSLPDFMVPAIYIGLSALPVTVNGKLDRRALPAPDRQRPELADAYAPPRNATEQRLCELFADMLGLDEVGRHDHFFDLGGHSLLAVRTLKRIHAEVSTVPTIAAFFATPTPAALAAAIDDHAQPRVVASRIASGEQTVAAEPVAIIAMAGRFPGAANVETFWDNLCAGRDSITHFDPGALDPSVSMQDRQHPSYVAARGVIDGVEEFDAPFFGMSPREAELTDPQQRLFLELCWECLERGGYVPDAHDGPVGIFGGMHNATYFQRHLASRPDLVEKFGAFAVMLANEKDYLTTRVAHRLNLTGPAVSMNTACSTSLVAIAQAFDALRAGRCDMALAGGASVACPPRSGYMYQEGSMLSPDGHTRSFDADAQGTVFSDGAAVVLLKRLSDAQRDGDPIYAVIRGAAINNDGGAKASFTAPSSAGQAAVIAMALRNAGVDARSISYVEAHGTATPLGDPIEIEGLTQAYRRDTDDCGYCAIGSVKSNVGHLVMAAGATGVIKAALSLKHALLPPSLHLRATNPKIDFVHSPFVVQAELSPWPVGPGPRRAGVSSFGVGGTNAHVILEEAPAQEPSEPATGAQLLVLSARSASALAQAAANLADHLAANPALNLADAAWTLRTGRKLFAYRTCVTATDIVGAIARLREPVAMRGPAMPNAPGVVFMLPGQGSQYAGMGRQLYTLAPAFRTALDTVADALGDELGFDLRERMFSDDADALRATALTQPATFAIEYALAQLWISSGVQPAAMLGHSVGEFVAAAVAGVMPLADAARLVARRGRMMQAMPPGAMLSVRSDAAGLVARMPVGLALAAENGPNASVVSGPSDAVEAFRQELEGAGVACRLLHTSHAFHSSMMDPVLDAFRAEVERVALAPPSIPIVSTLTGAPLDAADAVSADYWTRHLRGTVRFSTALQHLLADPSHAFVEVGPRTALVQLARQHPQSRGRVVLASLSDIPDGEHVSWLDALGQLWCHGAETTLETLDRRTRKQHLCLPTYPFERKRHWIDAPVASPASNVTVLPLPTPSPPPAASPSLPLPEPMSMAVPAAAIANDRPKRLTAELIALFEDVSGNEFDSADADANFVELGLDSLSLTQIALQLQKTFALKITFRELMESCSSFERLAMHIDRLLPPDTQADASATTPAAAIATAPMVSAAVAMPMAGGNLVQDVIQLQMSIMQQQLALLAGAGNLQTTVSVAQPVAPVQAAPPQPSPSQPPLPQSVQTGAEPLPGDEEAALAHTTYDVKKAFGAIARIHSTSTELTSRQRARLDVFMRRYIERTQRSKAYTQEHRAHLADPRVVNGFRPLLKEIVYQIVVERSKGSRVWDLDGNEYIDALNGFGMNLFGWQPDFVLDAVRKQLDAGYEIGPQHPLAGDVAKQVCELTGFDRAALCNTGSEAVMGTVRIARTVTGRDTLVIFTGSYHGIFDEVIVRGTKKLRSVPAAPGILRNTSENVLVLDYGTPESLAIIRERASSIAAVLVEPVQSRRPDFQPREFLQELRAITSDAGALLIFDEVVTGFRSHPRGAQAVLGIDADLASYGKVVGGGFPIGVIAGKRKYMDALDGGAWQFGDASVPTVGVTYFAGTFVRHPLALAAADAVLKHLKQNGQELQDRLNARTTRHADELNTFCTEFGAPIRIVHFASVWKVNFLEDHPLQDLLFAMMRSRGIHILDNFPCFFTTAHSEADFAAIAKAFRDSVLELQEAEFLPRRQRASVHAIDADKPPVHGARLGKDAEGNPAWFVPNPDAPGKFMRISA